MGTLLVASIGNARVALGAFALPLSEGVPSPVLSVAFDLPGKGPFGPRFEPPGTVDAAVMASVNPATEAAVRGWIADRFGVVPLAFPADVPAPLEVRYEPAEAVGSDRLADAVAAFESCRAACVVVDAGTAITVDAVSADGAFVGGAILPGPALSAQALARGTALVDEHEVAGPGPAIGTSTRAAVSSGVLRGLAGSIDRLAEDIAAELGGCDHFLATGGDAGRFVALCKTPLRRVPHLTLAGLAIAWSRWAAG